MRLYVFSHPMFNGMSIIAVIAYNESEARDLAADYDNGIDIEADDLVLESVKPLNKGVVIYEYE
jgi:hypothetical protein